MRSGKFDSASSKLPGRLSSQGGGGGATWSPMGARNRLDGRARPPPEPRSRDTQNQTASHLASATSEIRPRNIHPTAFVLYAVKSFRHSGSRRTFVCMSVRLVCRGRGNTAHSSHLTRSLFRQAGVHCCLLRGSSKRACTRKTPMVTPAAAPPMAPAPSTATPQLCGSRHQTRRPARPGCGAVLGQTDHCPTRTAHAFRRGARPGGAIFTGDEAVVAGAAELFISLFFSACSSKA